MKEAIKNNKKIIIIGVAIIILLLIGIAFAYLVTTLHGQEEYVLRAGTLNLELDDKNELTLSSQIPLEDKEGMTLEGFNFSLINHGNIETDYTIYLDDIALDEGETRMPDSSIRYSLTKNEVAGSPDNLSNMGANPNRVVDKGSIAVDETINYTLRIWIDYDATSEEAGGKTFKGKLRVVATQPVGEKASTVLLENIPEENQYDDGVDTFITGEDPNNYIWYSGKLWRAVSVNNDAKTTKLVTQWNISSITYSSSSTDFAGSYMEDWLNDTSADGFLGNLRDYENFIVTDAKWNATLDATSLGSITRPSDSGTIVTDAVGLLNMYEYQSSYNGTTYSNGYLNNGLYWWTITPYSSSDIRRISTNGSAEYISSIHAFCVRPSINLKSNIRIVDGDGTVDNPYRLNGDNDSNLSGTLLNTRYSGEYIKFGNDENNLYRIVSHETSGLTKITSAEPLKSSGNFLSSAFDSSSGVNYSNANTIGSFLNNDYLNIENGYLTNEDIAMIEESSTWYLGTVANGVSYKLAKYTDVTGTESISSIATAKVGLLRFGELMAGQFNIYRNNTSYWTITVYSSNYIRSVDNIGDGDAHSSDSDLFGIKPSLNLKSNVIITSGTGTKSDPFVLTLSS